MVAPARVHPVPLVDLVESLGSSSTVQSDRARGTVNQFEFWILSWGFEDLIEASKQLQNLWNFNWSFLTQWLTYHKISRDFNNMHFSPEFSEGGLRSLTKVWLASKIIQIISKNYEIIQRCYKSSKGLRKNIYRGLAQDFPKRFLIGVNWRIWFLDFDFP